MINLKQIILEELEKNSKYFHANRMRDSEFNYGPVYHGGGWNGKKSILSRTGALGVGAYFTPNRESAIDYAHNKGGYEGSGGGYLIEAYLNINKPLTFEYKEWRSYIELFTRFGIEESSVRKMFDKNWDKYGNPFKGELRKLAETEHYDCLIMNLNGEVSEIVLWYPIQQVKVTNVERV
jgi:hypothetical protein